MDKPHVDPGALLVAVFAVGVGPLTEDGPWDRINSVISAVVLAVVLCYLWPQAGISWPHLLAFCIVVSFIFAIGIAWPVQLGMGSSEDATTWERASYVALGIGCVALAATYMLFRPLTKRPPTTSGEG
jgi:hypothetical protein